MIGELELILFTFCDNPIYGLKLCFFGLLACIFMFGMIITLLDRTNSRRKTK